MPSRISSIVLLLTLMIAAASASIYDAAQAGDVAAVSAALEGGMSPDARSGDDNSLLDCAAVGGQPAVIRLLLACGAHVNYSDMLGDTALHKAAGAGAASAAVQCLLEHGARVNALNAVGELPLHFAARKGDVGAVQLLLDAGSKVNVRSSRTETQGMHHFGPGQTPLECARASGSTDVVQRLLLRGATDAAEPAAPSVLSDPRVFYGGLAVLLLVDLMLFSIFLQRRIERHRRFRVALAGAETGGVETVQAVLDTTHLAGPQLALLLWTAVLNGQHPIAALLLDHGADAGAEAPDGTPLLECARQKEDWEMVQLLLAHGAVELQGLPLTGLTYSPVC